MGSPLSCIKFTLAFLSSKAHPSTKHKIAHMSIDIYDIEGLAIVSESGDALYHVAFSEYNPQELYCQTVQDDEEISMFDNKLVVVRRLEEVNVVMYCSSNRNEIILSRALECFSAALSRVLKSCTKEYILKKYDVVCMLVNVFVFNGIVCIRDVDELVKCVPTRSFEGLEAMSVPQGFLTFFADVKKSRERRSG